MAKKAAAKAGKRWQDKLYEQLRAHDITQFCYVPDAGHSMLIEAVHADPEMVPVVLTTEEEGIAVNCGAWLGGDRSVLLMQSSGVGNCINTLSLVKNCQFPFLTLVTMRGEEGEFNTWQCPMSEATQTCLESMGVDVRRCTFPEEVKPAVTQSISDVFDGERAVAVLLSQALIGAKKW